jgi:hypothetical protein
MGLGHKVKPFFFFDTSKNLLLNNWIGAKGKVTALMYAL